MPKLINRSDEIDKRVGRNLRVLRLQRGLNQKKLADMLGVSHQQLQKYECGKNRLSASKLWEASVTLGVSIDDLFLAHADPDLACREPSLTPQGEANELVLFYFTLPAPLRKKLLALVQEMANAGPQ